MRAVQRLLGHAHGNRCFAVKLARKRHGFVHQLVMRHHFIDHAPCLSLCCVERFPEHANLGGNRHAHQSRQVVCRRLRHQTAFDKIAAEISLIAGDAKIRRKSHVVACAARDAVDRRDHRLG